MLFRSALRGVTLHVLGADGAPVPVGVEGELLIGGKAVATDAAQRKLLQEYRANVSAIAEAGSELSTLIVLNDHEEVGSGSAAGAQGPFLRAVLERMVPGSGNLL